MCVLAKSCWWESVAGSEETEWHNAKDRITVVAISSGSAEVVVPASSWNEIYVRPFFKWTAHFQTKSRREKLEKPRMAFAQKTCNFKAASLQICNQHYPTTTTTYVSWSHRSRSPTQHVSSHPMSVSDPVEIWSLGACFSCFIRKKHEKAPDSQRMTLPQALGIDPKSPPAHDMTRGSFPIDMNQYLSQKTMHIQTYRDICWCKKTLGSYTKQS